MARRIPISQVRSLTLTSMMFIRPMLPTTSEMPAIRESTSVMRSVMRVICSLYSSVSEI